MREQRAKDEAVDLAVGTGDGDALDTARQVAEAELGDVSGGIQGLDLSGPDGKFYGLVLRPLLPDEKD